MLDWERFAAPSGVLLRDLGELDQLKLRIEEDWQDICGEDKPPQRQWRSLRSDLLREDETGYEMLAGDEPVALLVVRPIGLVSTSKTSGSLAIPYRIISSAESRLRAVEKKQLPHMLCVTNMLLHGIEDPSFVRHDNTLARPYISYTQGDRVDIVLTAPLRALPDASDRREEQGRFLFWTSVRGHTHAPFQTPDWVL
jgi:hypothetical protein